MTVSKFLDPSRIAVCWVLLLGTPAGCFPDFDGLSSGREGDGGTGAGTGGALSGSAGIGGTTRGGTGGKGGEAAGSGNAGRGGSDTGGSDTGGSGGSAGGMGGAGGSSAGGGSGTSGNAGAGGSGMAGGGGKAGGGAGSGGAGAGGAGGQAGVCIEGMGGGGMGEGGTGDGGMGGDGMGGDGTGDEVTATGVEKLSVPLMFVDQGQRYNVQNRTDPSMPFDLGGETLTIRAYAPCAIGGNLSVFFRSPGGFESPKTKVALSTLVREFIDVPVPVPAATGGFDPALVDIIRIEVEADAAYGSTFRSPATVVYIDSVLSSNGAVTHRFDTQPVYVDFGESGARPLAGSTNQWLAVYP